MIRKTMTTIIAIAAALSASAALADTVALTDGSLLVGRLQRLGSGKLAIETQFAGVIEVDAAMIASVSTDEAVNVGFTTGDRLVGPMSSDGSGRARLETELGTLAVNMDKVDAIWRQGDKSPEQLEADRKIAEAQAEAEAKVGKWTTTLEAGALFTEGNKEILQARGRIELAKKSTIDLLRFYLQGAYGEEDDRRSEAEAKAGTYYEHMLFGNERFVGYIQSEAEYDEFENLDLRFTAGGGLGYYWIKEDTHELKTSAGIGYLHESYMDNFTRDTAQAEIGLDYMVDVTDWLKFTHSADYYPTFDGLDDYRLVFDTAVLMPLGTSEVWKLKLGATHEYDSIPRPGFERLDQTYYANIVLELKEQ